MAGALCATATMGCWDRPSLTGRFEFGLHSIPYAEGVHQHSPGLRSYPGLAGTQSPQPQRGCTWRWRDTTPLGLRVDSEPGLELTMQPVGCEAIRHDIRNRDFRASFVKLSWFPGTRSGESSFRKMARRSEAQPR